MPRERSPQSDAGEFAALLILILMFTPLAFGYLFVWLMVPLALLIKRTIASDDSTLLTYLLVALVTFNCHRNRAAFRADLWQPVFCRLRAISRTRDKSVAQPS